MKPGSLVALTILGLGTLAGTAAAATIAVTPAKPCYRSGETLQFAGTGFTAGGAVNLSLDGRALGTAAADASGNLTGALTLGTISGPRTLALTATDQSLPTNVATVSLPGADRDVRVTPARGRPGTKRRLRASGFAPGTRLYAHVVRKGVRRRTIPLGTLQGPCGTLDTRAALTRRSMPTGTYTIQFDSSPWYSRSTPDRVRYRLVVYRVLVRR